MKLTLILFILFTFPIVSKESPEEVFQFEYLRVIENPNFNPRSPISDQFIPEKAKVTRSMELSNLTGIPTEVVLVLHSTETPEELLKFYEAIFLSRDWRILQKNTKGNKSVLLGENVTKKVMTVLIRDEISYRVVKLLYKRPGF